MMKSGKILFGLVALVLWGGFAIENARAKLVMAHYMPWYESQPYTGYWGWHWTMSHFNPDNDNTNGYPEIASWYYPQIGLYDSDDPALLEYHVLLMKLAGIDGVIADWYGTDNFNDYALINQRTADLFAWLQKAGLQFCLCYEDATIQQEINKGFITASGAVAHAQQTMLYAQSNYFTMPGYLHWNNKPVLLDFGPQYFADNSQWTSIFSALNPTNAPAFFTEDSRYSIGQGGFDWPPMSMTRTNNGVLTDAMMISYLTNFEQKATGWPAYISTAFPRFHDIYQQAGAMPSYGYLDDQSGTTLRENLSRAMTNSSIMVQIATWNDFGEGTIIEPAANAISGSALIDTNQSTVEYGYTDLGIIQDLRRQFLDAGFPYHTNNLTLPLRLFNLRKLYGNSSPMITAELNCVFSNIVSGNLAIADLQLNGVETGPPAIYGQAFTNNRPQNSILSATTNQVKFSTLLSPGATPAFSGIAE
jgi:hypothetical protein